MNLFVKSAVVAAAFVTLSAHAFPIAAPGTEGFLVVASGGDVKATYQGNSASYSNNLWLVNTNTFVFNNHANTPGDMVDLGSFAAGTELLFKLEVTNTGDNFYTGPASRNLDNKEHARVQNNWQTGETLVSFEDLFGTPEGVNGFNDLSFSFTNTESTPNVPEPETYALMLAGLGVVGFMARRRKS